MPEWLFREALETWMRRLILTVVVAAVVLSRLDAAPPDAPAVIQRVIGNPVSVEVEPAEVTLRGPRATQQILVTGHYEDGSARDLTHFCDWTTTNADLLTITDTGLASGRQDGAVDIEIQAGSHHVTVPVTIAGSGQPQPISFRREVMPVLSAAGCSDIRCHGAPSGKDGFRLSLWGSDPSLDFQQLTRDGYGRRTNVMHPSQSLILLKPLTHVSHAGGKRFMHKSAFADVLRDWQSQGLRDDPTASRLATLDVVPARRVLHAPAQWQQLAVRATYEDGTTEDVTQRTTFSSTDLAIATVDRGGLVEFKHQGEVAILCRYLGQMHSIRLLHIAAPPADYVWAEPAENNYIDRHVFAKLKLLHISPSPLCNDATFVRRVYLDLCGVLPTPDESRAFVASAAPDKREQLVDELLQRPEYADYWTKKWMDVLRVSRDSIQLAGAQAYHGWLRERVEADVPLTDVVRELLTSVGESYSDPAVNFYCAAPTPKEVKDPLYLQKDLAEATAQLFLGVRLQCAQCHNHPYERWTQNDYLSLAAFFTQVSRSRLGKAGPSGRPDRRQMAVALDPKAAEIKHEETGAAIEPGLLGEAAVIESGQDRRSVLAAWLTKDDNPFFAKAVVNRVWFHLHGRGIVEPVDDFRDSNPSANDALLDALAADFVAGGYRLRPLIRAIVTSRTYQLSSNPSDLNRGDTRYFSHMMARPLPAEVLLDAICNVTGVVENYEIMQDYITGIPTDVVRMPPGTRAVELPVTDIVTLINTSGKYVRYESHPFLRTFGQPIRSQTCECDRESNFTRKQALEMLVGVMVNEKVSDPANRLGERDSDGRSADEVLAELYQRALARPPSRDAAAAFLEHIAAADDKRQAWEDVLWTLLNSQEFIFQH